MNAHVDDREIVTGFVQDIKSPGYPDRLGSYMFVHSGNLFFPCDPRPEEVHIEDIAAGLAGISRFNGQTREYVTIAEHCWLCSHYKPEIDPLEKLLHDAAEGWIGDKIRPLKIIPAMAAVYLPIERGIERAVAMRFNLRYPWSAAVKEADEAVLNAEVVQNITVPDALNVSHLSDKTHTANLELKYWSPKLARQMFLARFRELMDARGD